ncbi:MAG TPA: hypothetical protein VF624_06885, partial [Tepidisphaeraceae bacterium]
RIVERASVRALFKKPLHPYTKQLLAAVTLDHQTGSAVQADETDAALPTGWQFDEPTDHIATPELHTLEDTRHLLLWPTQELQERSV